MHCVICKHGETRPGTTTETFHRDGVVVVFRHVPAEVCENCGEAYLDEDTTRRVLDEAEMVMAGGAVFDVRDYRAA